MNSLSTSSFLVLTTMAGSLDLQLPGWFRAAPITYAEESSVTGEWNVEQLIRGLAKQREEVVFFEETTFSAFLTEPLKTRGTLKFTPPSRLEKHVTDPYEERYVVDGDKVLFESKKKRVSRSLALDDHPALRIFVEAFLSSFAGDATRLRRFYDVTLQGKPRQWTLILQPLQHTNQSVFRTVRLSGENRRIKRIETLAPDGDRAVMVVTKAAP